jgi:hypothetical protein
VILAALGLGTQICSQSKGTAVKARAYRFFLSEQVDRPKIRGMGESSGSHRSTVLYQGTALAGPYEAQR